MAKGDTQVQRIKRYWEASRRLREAYDVIWENCIRKCAGQHWMTYNAEYNRFYPMRRSVQNKRMTLHRTNMIRKDVDILKWVLMDQLPHPTARPAPGHGPHDDKQRLCNYTTGLMEHTWKDQNHEDIYEDIALALLTIGNVYQRPIWNPNDPRAVVPITADPEMVEQTVPQMMTLCTNCGTQQTGYKEQCDVCGMEGAAIVHEERDRSEMVEQVPMGPDGQPLTVKKAIGNIGIEYIPAHEIYFPRMARSIRHAGYLFRLRYAPLGWVRKVSGNSKVAPQPIDATQIYNWQINTITGSALQFAVEDPGDTTVDDMAPFLEYWEKPNPENPKGVYKLFTDFNFERADKEGEYPVPYSSPLADSFGLIHDVYRKVTGRFLGAGLVEDLVPINNQHNSEISQLDYMRTRFLNAKVITYQGSGVTDANMNADSDTVDVLSPQQKPEMLQVITPIPQLIEHVNVTLNRFREMSGVSQSMEGAQPGSVRANSAISALTQQAIMPVIGIKKRMLRNMEKLYAEILRLMQEHYTMPHMRELIGIGDELDFKQFKGADLDKPGVVAWVDVDKAYPTTKQEDREAFEKLIQYQPMLIQQQAAADPAFFQVILDMFGMSREQYNAQYNAQTRAAHRKIELFLQNNRQQTLMPDPMLDNPMMYAYVYERFLLGDRGIELQRTNPQQYDAIKQALGAHKDVLQKQQMAMQPNAPPNGNGQGQQQPQPARQR